MSSSHETLQELASLYALEALTPDERAEFDAHMSGCPTCRAEVAALRPVTAALAHAVPQTDTPASLRARVIRRATGGEPVAADVRQSHARTAAPPKAAWLLIAASLVAAVALGAYSIRLRSRIADLDSRLQQALMQRSLAERQIADARRSALDAQLQLAVLAAPDLVRVDLIGQSKAPGASGRAFWSRSRGMVFTASNLPSLPAGRVYQVWVLTAAGPPISVGLLPASPTADSTVVFETAPDIPQPAQVAVSDEPTGGVPAPTGAIWLAGKPVA
jgi:anti-sigma-K factor RskA